jgi:hypothetical protein
MWMTWLLITDPAVYKAELIAYGGTKAAVQHAERLTLRSRTTRCWRCSRRPGA